MLSAVIEQELEQLREWALQGGPIQIDQEHLRRMVGEFEAMLEEAQRLEGRSEKLARMEQDDAALSAGHPLRLRDNIFRLPVVARPIPQQSESGS